MRKTILLLFLIISKQAFAQLETIESLKFNDNIYDIVIIKASSNNLKKFFIYNNNELLNHNTLMNELNDSESYFAINAGTVHQDCSPVGLLIDDFDVINSINLEEGEGNFFLKPNGTLSISDNDVSLLPSESFIQLRNLKLAIQSGPMLVINGNIHPDFNPNSTNLNLRNGVGVFEDKKGNKFLIFANSKEPVSFYNFSKLFIEKYNCLDALCLESAGNIMKLPYSDAIEEKKNHTICRYLMYND